jgi:hypothetical protein
MHGLPDWREMRIVVVPEGEIHLQSIGIELQSSEFTDVFSAIAQDLVHVLSGVEDDSRRLSELRDRLKKWNRFMKEHGHQGLGEDEVRGLFAELWVLREHVMAKVSPITALRCWVGPEAEAQDFVHGDRAIEVKSTTSSHPDFIFISSEHQLDSTGLRSLWLDVVRLEDSGLGQSLPELVEDIRTKLACDSTASSEFDAKLARAGYLDVSATRYDRKYEVASEAIFEVRKGFPRIVQPPTGIQGVRYRLSVGAIKPFRTVLEGAFSAFTGVKK